MWPRPYRVRNDGMVVHRSTGLILGRVYQTNDGTWTFLSHPSLPLIPGDTDRGGMGHTRRSAARALYLAVARYRRRAD